MAARAELGKGGGLTDIINVQGVEGCPAGCVLKGKGNGRFRCQRYNGGAEVTVIGGITRYTLAEFTEAAPCINKEN